MRLSRDFHRLWGAYSVSELGSALGSGALPLIALLVLDSSNLQVSLLAALSGVASAAIALPLGSWIEYRRKRPVMIGADLVRCAALGSIPVAMALGGLTYWQLCLVGVVQTAGNIVFTAASGAHLKALVPAEGRVGANSRFETTFWTMTSAGPPLGGLLISWWGAAATVAVDAVSFLLSALGIRALRAPEPPPPVRAPGQGRVDLVGGWRYILGHAGLRALFWNAMLFGGSLMLAAPLLAVLMLRELGFAPWQYGLALGLPGLGGILGSLLARPLTGRFGARAVLLAFGVGRTLWLGLLPWAPTGTAGLVLIVVAETGLLFCAGVFNPTFVTYRMAATPDGHMSRVGTAWSISSKSVQPAFMVAGGVLAAATSVRTAIAVGAVVLLGSGLLLPWRAETHTPSVASRGRRTPRIAR
ncbi:MFS transporter [Longispora urticae]